MFRNRPDTATINSKTLFDTQRRRYRETLAGTVIVPAGSEALLKIDISTLGNYWCNEITGSYETLTTANVDDGVCRTFVQITDGANALPLTNDYVSTDLLFSPGRVRSANATNNLTTAAPSSFLFYPLKFDYTFPAAGSANFRVRNTSTVDIKISIAIHGYRVRD